MNEIAVERFQLRVRAQSRQQIGAHGDQCRRAAGRAVEATENFLTARLGRVMQASRIVFAGVSAPRLNRTHQRIFVRPKAQRQRRVETQPARIVKAR